VLFIWASRNYEPNNPQNIIRRADCLRILTPWRAFGDLKICCELVSKHEAELITEINWERDTALADIENAYKSFLDSLQVLRREADEFEAFAKREAPIDKEERKIFREDKKRNGERLKAIRREIKVLERLERESEEKRTDARVNAERQTALAKSAAADLLRICGNSEEAARYFVIAGKEEIKENEFNLNLPRYINTFEPEKQIEITDALERMSEAESACSDALEKLREKLGSLTEVAQ
jgi:type I restriction enzyme M protein